MRRKASEKKKKLRKKKQKKNFYAEKFRTQIHQKGSQTHFNVFIETMWTVTWYSRVPSGLSRLSPLFIIWLIIPLIDHNSDNSTVAEVHCRFICHHIHRWTSKVTHSLSLSPSIHIYCEKWFVPFPQYCGIQYYTRVCFCSRSSRIYSEVISGLFSFQTPLIKLRLYPTVYTLK